MQKSAKFPKFTFAKESKLCYQKTGICAYPKTDNYRQLRVCHCHCAAMALPFRCMALPLQLVVICLNSITSSLPLGVQLTFILIRFFQQARFLGQLDGPLKVLKKFPDLEKPFSTRPPGRSLANWKKGAADWTPAPSGCPPAQEFLPFAHDPPTHPPQVGQKPLKIFSGQKQRALCKERYCKDWCPHHGFTQTSCDPFPRDHSPLTDSPSRWVFKSGVGGGTRIPAQPKVRPSLGHIGACQKELNKCNSSINAEVFVEM